MRTEYWKNETLETKMAKLLQGNTTGAFGEIFFYQTKIIGISAGQKSKSEHATSQDVGPNE